MPLNSTVIGTALGLAIAAWFGVFCRRSPQRAIVLLVALAWVPYPRVFELSGSRISQSLFMVEVLSTVLIACWWFGRLHPPRPAIVLSPVNRPLLLIIPVSLISLLWSLGGVDPNVPAQNVKLAVSVGQVLLLVWPVGLYFAAANTIRDTRTMQTIVRMVVVMAIPSIALPFVPAAWRTYLSWSIYFALVASPLCFAASFDTRSPLRKIGYWMIAVSPLIHGISIGKAFLYATTSIALLVVAHLKGRKVLVAAIPIALGVYVLAAAATGSFVPWPLEELLDIERKQQSWGGRAGRLALAADTLAIWARHPIFGVGPGNSWPYMHRYSVIDTPHNQYLNLLLELGIVGVGCFVWFIAGALKTGVDALRNIPDGFCRTLVVGWFGFFCGMVVSALTGDFIFHSIRNGGLEMFSAYYLQWIFLGMVVRAVEIEGRAA